MRSLAFSSRKLALFAAHDLPDRGVGAIFETFFAVTYMDRPEGRRTDYILTGTSVVPTSRVTFSMN